MASVLVHHKIWHNYLHWQLDIHTYEMSNKDYIEEMAIVQITHL